LRKYPTWACLNAQGKAVIVDTTHGDLLEDLTRRVLVHKRFGEEIKSTTAKARQRLNVVLSWRWKLKKETSKAGKSFVLSNIEGIRLLFIEKSID